MAKKFRLLFGWPLKFNKTFLESFLIIAKEYEFPLIINLKKPYNCIYKLIKK